MIDDIYDVIELVADIIEFIIDLFKHKKSKNNDKIYNKKQ